MDFGFGLVGIAEEQVQPKSKSNNNSNNHGSLLIKQERSDPFEGKRVSKLSKWVDDSGLISDHNNNNKQQMLNFSDGNLNEEMNGCIAGIRGTFTPAQWVELEHQAMIYKYFTANLPVPSNLLIPIRKAIQSAAFPGFSIGSYPFHSYGWGSFHLGFSGNTDPEPGRCRRTDGKKWRCSRDAVPDQKYCERHINRGRHRSRKPVEGHTGQAASGAATTKMIPRMSTSMSSLGTSGGIVPGDVISPHQTKGCKPIGATNNASSDPIAKRVYDQQSLPVMPPSISLKTKDSQFSVPKQHASFNESLVSDFGIVSNDALLNPSQKNTYSDCGRYDSLMGFNTQPDQDQYPLRHFIDNWPKDESHSSISWSKDVKSDLTQLSMSIPMSTEKVSVSPLRFNMGFEVGNSVGGPLGEALLNNAMGMGEIWDGSPQLGSSPTDVLQKSTFVSFSNRNSGESPMLNYENLLSLGSSAHAMSPSIHSV